MGLSVKLGSVSTVVLDCVDMRKCLHAEFTVEAAAQRIEDLVLFLRPMPDCTRLVYVFPRAKICVEFQIYHSIDAYPQIWYWKFSGRLPMVNQGGMRCEGIRIPSHQEVTTIWLVNLKHFFARDRGRILFHRYSELGSRSSANFVDLYRRNRIRGQKIPGLDSPRYYQRRSRLRDDAGFSAGWRPLPL